MSAGRVKFEEFELDFERYELLRNGQTVKLEKNPMELLRLLVEKSGTLVSRQEIVDRLWGNGVHLDTEHGINTAVRKVRLVLKDDPECPRFVRTVTGKGYTFIAPLEKEKPKPNGDHGLDDDRRKEPVIEPTRRWPRAHSAIIALLIVFAGALLLWRFGKASATSGAPPLTAVPLTALPGIAESPAFSPDGTQVAYVWDGNGSRRQIYVQSLTTAAKAIVLTRFGPETQTDLAPGLGPVWSPDGKWIAFGRYRAGGPPNKPIEIVMVPAPSGGQEVALARTADCCHGLAWSPDSRYLAYADYGPGEPSAIFLLDRTTLTSRKLTTPPGGNNSAVGDSNPVFYPDGKKLAFMRSPTPGVNQIQELDLDSQQTRVVLSEFSSDSSNGALATDVSGQSLIYVSDRGGIKRLWRVPISGGEPEPLNVGEDAWSVAVAASGNRLAFTQGLDDVNIWRLQVGGDHADSRSPLIASSRKETQPVMSPDGTKIAFASDRSGFDEIWTCNADGTDPVQLTKLGRHKTGTPQWSPDGRFLAFDSRSSGHADIYVISVAGGEPRRLTNDAFDNSVPAWSPDGEWIYYESTCSGSRQVWKTRSAGGEPVQVTQQGGGWPVMGPDGRYLYYLKTLAPAVLWRKDLPNGTEAAVDGLPEIVELNFQVSADGIYFTAPDSDGEYLKVFRFKDRKVYRLQQLGSQQLDFGLWVSGDARTVLWSQHDRMNKNIMLVVGFR